MSIEEVLEELLKWLTYSVLMENKFAKKKNFLVNQTNRGQSNRRVTTRRTRGITPIEFIESFDG